MGQEARRVGALGTGPSARAAAWLVLVLLFAAVPARGAPTEDAFVAGYAAAILQREFRLSPDGVTVRDGVVFLRTDTVTDGMRAALIAALEAIPGVRRVVLTEPPAPAAPVAAASPATRTLLTGFLPGGELFKPLTADPRWPHFSLAYRYRLDDADRRNIFAPSLGETLTLYRADVHGTAQWELGLLAVVYPIMDVDAQSLDLVNLDVLMGGFAAYRAGSVSILARLFHQSSHLGDELVLAEAVERVNLSFEKLDLLLSWEPTPTVRVYGGPGVLTRVDPADLAPGSLQLGAEVTGAAVAAGARPILALDVQARENVSWDPDVSVRGGFEFERLPSGQRVQLLLHYFNGHSPDGQFFREPLEYVGAGVHFHF